MRIAAPAPGMFQELCKLSLTTIRQYVWCLKRQIAVSVISYTSAV